MPPCLCLFVGPTRPLRRTAQIAATAAKGREDSGRLPSPPTRSPAYSLRESTHCIYIDAIRYCFHPIVIPSNSYLRALWRAIAHAGIMSAGMPSRPIGAIIRAPKRYYGHLGASFLSTLSTLRA